MRKIKFRGLRTDGKGWVYGYLFVTTHNTAGKMFLKPCIQQIHENNFWYDTFEVIPESVCQFTGLKDKNGKEIYEGKDSLELHLIGLGRGNVDVVMHKGSWSIYCESQGYAPLNEMLINTSCELHVIGTINEKGETK